MKLIHIFLWIKKLFTLKHSWNLMNCSLKRSCSYAETLLPSIYTYIYLYKRTCSWCLQVVNNGDKKFFISPANFAINKFTLVILIWLSLSGCCHKSVYIYNQPIHKIGITERSATTINPSQFYLCGNTQYPCSTVNYTQHFHLHHPISSHHQQKRKGHEKQIVKQTCTIK